LIAGYFYTCNDTIKETEEDIITTKKEEKVEEDVYIYVDIKGAVVNPGVYKMYEGDKVSDVIMKAGGLTEIADTSITNLAYKITDELAFKIYTKDEVKELFTETVATESDICPTETNLTCTTTNLTTIEDKEEETDLISINTGTSEQLQTLTGIGPTIATKIINYRTENGDFETIEDIKNVSGIGDSLFAKIKDYITI